MSVEYSFDGTNVKFDIVAADASGLVPQTNKVSSLAVSLFDPLGNSDAASISASEIGSTGTYRISTPFAQLNTSSGMGLWNWKFSHPETDLTFVPPSVSFNITRQVANVKDSASTVGSCWTTLTATLPDSYRYSFQQFVTGVNVNVAPRMITASTSGGMLSTTELWPTAPSSGDIFVLIES